MPKPKRGEIFRAKMYGRRGTELEGKGPEKERPCLIVSSDLFNKYRTRVTVAPITSYYGSREDARPLWGIPIQLADGLKSVADFDIDITNFDYPEEEQLQVWLKDQRMGRNLGNWIYYPKSNKKIPFKSIIDCGQLYTVNSFDLDENPELKQDYDVDVLWERRHGSLKEKATLCIDAALQMLIDGGVRYHNNDLRFRAGDVILAYLTGPDLESSQQYCLVISSPGIDAIRQRMPAFKTVLTQCTVVPLIPIMKEDGEDDPGIAFVTVYAVGRREAPRKLIANCQEIQTIDWQSRRATHPPEWRLDDNDIVKVRKAVRDYLALPR